MLTPEQVEQRRNGIGSSDVPAICDLYPSTWSSRRRPEDVLREKLGETLFEGNARTERGDWLEPLIAERWSSETGRPIVRNTVTTASTTIPWALASADFFIDETPRGVLEVKLVGQFAGKTWANGPPQYVEAQVQYQLGVLGLEHAVVAALIEGDRDFAGPRAFDVPFRPGVFAHIVEICGLFWARVLEARAERERRTA